MKKAINRNRRIVLAGGILGGLALLAPGLARADKWITSNVIKDKKTSFPFVMSEEEWKKRLSPEAYRILREHGTERAGSSSLNHENVTVCIIVQGVMRRYFRPKPNSKVAQAGLLFMPRLTAPPWGHRRISN